MAWKSYELDQIAQGLVLKAKLRDKDSLNQAHKMRMSTAYGLERFWGEHLRLHGKEPAKSAFWKSTWDALATVLEQAQVALPNDPIDPEDTRAVQAMAGQLWSMQPSDQRIALAILTQLCDCIVWWTQRYK